MSSTPNLWLLLGAVLSAVAGLLHLGIIVGGAAWYHFFGAGESMARMAEAGRWYPAVLTGGIALVLFVWSAYALAGAGWPIPHSALPWPKTVLGLITTVYLLRGLVVLPMWLFAPAQVTPFMLWSSVVCGVFGVVHFVGLAQVWESL